MTLSRFVRFPLTRIVIACCALGGASFETQVTLLRMGLVRALYDPAASPYLYSVSTLLAFVASYVVYVGVVERRSVGELSPAKGPVDLGAGFLLGIGLFTITIGSIWLAGGYEVTGFDEFRAAGPWLFLSVASGFAEEILVRGVIFRITEEGLGTWIALAISSLLFGMAHIRNPGATLLSGLAVALEAGVLLAAGFVLTRRLWLPIGLHAGWNFAQGGIFGVAVSGFQFGGILKSGLHGPEILSGGAFGAEASIFAVVYCLVAGVCLLVAARRAGRFVPPFWARPRGGTPAAPLILAARGGGGL
ncbi:MAG: hypothetical protein AUI47_05680 [Acidobacteria bacterium 13_1_40CM_2_68_5]|nr:MAG: hypothetical protein AUI47_05680 [Acidobacteria bacterium 13_1_40CM_2_68_5]